jgi:hypothetical protein
MNHGGDWIDADPTAARVAYAVIALVWAAAVLHPLRRHLVARGPAPDRVS